MIFVSVQTTTAAFLVLAGALLQFFWRRSCEFAPLLYLSCGAYASWELTCRYPDNFAAVLPSCGGIITPQHLRKLHPELANTAYHDDPKS